MKQKELSKLINDETMVIKPADKGEVVVILLIGNHQGMVMKQLLDESIYKKLDFCIGCKTK